MADASNHTALSSPSQATRKSHPTHAAATKQVIMGGVAILIGIVVGATTGYWLLFWLLLPVGAMLVGFGAYARLTGPTRQVINEAGHLALTGQLSEAEAFLDRAESTCRVDHLRLAIDLLRATISMRRGDLRRTLEHTDAAIARPMNILTRHIDQQQMCHARGLRALVRAALGERDAAREDIKWVRAVDHTTPEPLARAALAEAVLLEQSHAFDELREFLGRNRALLLENPSYRERAIVRAYQRMLSAGHGGTSIYRKSAPKDEGSPNAEPALADWIATIASSAAPFAPSPRTAEAGPQRSLSEAAPNSVNAPLDHATRTAAESWPRVQKAPGRPVGRLIFIWAGCIVFFVAVWLFLAPTSPRPPAPVTPAPIAGDPMPLLNPALIVLAYGIVLWLLRHQLMEARKATNALAAARTRIARGDGAGGVSALKDLTRSKRPGVAAEAHLMLARLAERTGNLRDALSECEAGIGKFPTEYERAVAAECLFPSLLAERAFLFAAQGKVADASAEIDLVSQQYPLYTERSAAALRVKLAQHVREGDFEAAAQVAEGSSDLILFSRDEILADLAHVIARPTSVSIEEVERLEDELHGDKDLRLYIQAVAPSAMAAFEQARRALHTAERTQEGG